MRFILKRNGDQTMNETTTTVACLTDGDVPTGYTCHEGKVVAPQPTRTDEGYVDGGDPLGPEPCPEGSMVWYCQPTTTVEQAAATTTTVVLPVTTDAVCQEDEACWDCDTMGNLVCGPTTTVEVGVPPVPQTPTKLPETGGEVGLGVIAVVCILAGGLMRRVARRS